MSQASVLEIMQALAGQIEEALTDPADPLIRNLQVESTLVWNPTPPAIDIYPADPFQEGLAFGDGNSSMFFTVRARVDTAEHEGSQELLLEMMDPRSETSVLLALLEDVTLGSTVENLVVTGPSEYGFFVAPVPNAGALLGCTWRVEVLP